MRTKKLLLIIFALSFFSYKSQIREKDKWVQVLISIHGTVDHEGVEAKCMLTQCDSEPVLLMELTNTNTYKVKAEWLHSPMTKGGKQNYKDELQTIILDAKETKTGKCGGQKQLIIKLKDYGVKVEDLEDYYGSNFNVVKQ